ISLYIFFDGTDALADTIQRGIKLTAKSAAVLLNLLLPEGQGLLLKTGILGIPKVPFYLQPNQIIIVEVIIQKIQARPAVSGGAKSRKQRPFFCFGQLLLLFNSFLRAPEQLIFRAAGL